MYASNTLQLVTLLVTLTRWAGVVLSLDVNSFLRHPAPVVATVRHGAHLALPLDWTLVHVVSGVVEVLARFRVLKPHLIVSPDVAKKWDVWGQAWAWALGVGERVGERVGVGVGVGVSVGVGEGEGEGEGEGVGVSVSVVGVNKGNESDQPQGEETSVRVQGDCTCVQTRNTCCADIGLVHTEQLHTIIFMAGEDKG
jgi:hypothetical protein